jgi:hypothetical protein
MVAFEQSSQDVATFEVRDEAVVIGGQVGILKCPGNGPMGAVCPRHFMLQQADWTSCGLDGCAICQPTVAPLQHKYESPYVVKCVVS